MRILNQPEYWTSQLAEINRWFDRAMSPLSNGARALRFPDFSFEEDWGGGLAADIFEDEDRLYLRVDMPGIVREEVDLHLEKELLKLTVKRADSEEGEGFAYTREFRLPVPVDGEGVRAKLDEGVLHITLPRDASAKPRRIALE